MNGELLSFEDVEATDAEQLVWLRIAAAGESRAHRTLRPATCQRRFLKSFEPPLTRHIVFDRKRVGFLVVSVLATTICCSTISIFIPSSRSGHRAAVLASVFAEADELGKLVRVGALRESASNRFYMRYGFELVEVDEWDNYYVRKASVEPLH